MIRDTSLDNTLEVIELVVEFPVLCPKDCGPLLQGLQGPLGGGVVGLPVP